MALNAAARAALRKQKDGKTSKVTVKSDVEEMRSASRSKLEELAGNKELACEIEEEMFRCCGGVTQKYRTAFRRLYICLRNPDTKAKDRLTNEDLSPSELVHLAVEGKTDALKADWQLKADEKMKEVGLKQTVGKKLVPASLETLMDGREASKWGMGKSQAAKD